MSIEDALELLIEVFDGARAQSVSQTAHRLGVVFLVGAWVTPMSRSDQNLSARLAFLAHRGRIIMSIAQHKTHFGWDVV